ncbi:hypothetical protein [Streptomyces sp. NBC_01264]|uniref:hypothetical protein n=1 Tax=Streptomyces sp. NBC_01264 TaxID=2903804 RepID=UPI002255A22B|nr:hypothetical protein [Streptomyces sp. NBC_01264]MCX4775939.1 hypothetical protein [Streptomyces sp. NBC_01264]
MTSPPPPPPSPAAEREVLAITEEGVVRAATAKQRVVELSKAAALIREIEKWQQQGIPELVTSTIPALQEAAEAFQSIVWEEKRKVSETRRQAEQRIADADSPAPETGADQLTGAEPDGQRAFDDELSRRLWEVSELQAQEENAGQRVAAAAEQLLLVQEIVDTAQFILKYYAQRDGASAVAEVLAKVHGTEKILDAVISIGPNPTRKGMLVRKACLEGHATAREVRSLLAGGWLGQFPELQNEFTLKLAVLEECLERFRVCQAMIESGDLRSAALPLVEQTLQTVQEEVVPAESRWNDLVEGARRTAAEIEQDIKKLVATVSAGAPPRPSAPAGAITLDPDERYLLKTLTEHLLEEELTDDAYNAMVRNMGLDSLMVDGSGHKRASVELAIAQVSLAAGAKAEQVGADIDKTIGEAKTAIAEVRRQADTGFSNFGKILKGTLDDLANKVKEKK